MTSWLRQLRCPRRTSIAGMEEAFFRQPEPGTLLSRTPGSVHQPAAYLLGDPPRVHARHAVVLASTPGRQASARAPRTANSADRHKPGAPRPPPEPIGVTPPVEADSTTTPHMEHRPRQREGHHEPSIDLGQQLVGVLAGR